jgi:predicted TIM-barrel fold metal-dependent hydrolase
MAHIGGEAANMEKAIDVINRHDNIYGDFAVSRTWERNVEWLVSEVGSEKLLFGSDTPYFLPVPTVARIAMAEIGEEEKKNILGLNMKKILKI